jgi:hypothetical protein
MPVFVCLISSYSHVAQVGGPEVCETRALKFDGQNDGDFMNIILLYNWHLSVSTLVDRFVISNVESVIMQ